ncbi:hypothetical protein PFLmoz3_03453 [Pseudomonas fluorescens]|uniref:Uncharacterized protein n=1 Tax=Pseudomonas fluorescens TaxID=294 RepID=A0A109LG86_PSEFL|nr:hypothetical protein PFLmoz3_03453 [Pseudomonas fluorescens]
MGCQDLGENLVVALVQFFEGIEFGAILGDIDRPCVAGHMLLKPSLERLVVLFVGFGNALVLVDPDQLLGLQVAVDPGAANHGAEKHPGHRIVPH